MYRLIAFNRMKRVLFLLVAAVFTANFAQAQSELIYHKGAIMQDGTKLMPPKVKEVMSGNSEALKTYKSGQIFLGAGTFSSGIGVCMIGWDLGTRLGGGEGNGTLLAVGAVVWGVGLGFVLIGDAKTKKSVTLYNSTLSSNSVSYQINFGFTPTGVGLSIRF